jgi:hypothetical protein
MQHTWTKMAAERMRMVLFPRNIFANSFSDLSSSYSLPFTQISIPFTSVVPSTQSQGDPLFLHQELSAFQRGIAKN